MAKEEQDLLKHNGKYNNNKISVKLAIINLTIKKLSWKMNMMETSGSSRFNQGVIKYSKTPHQLKSTGKQVLLSGTIFVHSSDV